MPTRSPTARLIPQLRRAVLASPDAGPTDGRLLAEFVRAGDQDAFAALVRRHGSMVLGVCRRVVGNAHDADDAFQATFLVLARRAGSVRPRERVGNWLYGVAYRTALKARAVRARRRVRESQVDPMPHPQAPTRDVWPDLLPVLDAELARLPDRLRLPVVLCDLEGRTQREVARQLGLPPATLANRLASARRTLAKRLTDRGVTLSGGALAAVVSANAARASVPPTLAASAVQAAGLVAAGGAWAGAVPAQVVRLSEGVIRMMVLSKLKPAVVAVVVACAGGLGVLPALRAADEPAGQQPAAGAKADPTKPGLGPSLTDEEFLRRVCVDLRGTLPSDVEMTYFTADPDPAKRRKVVGWLTEPGGREVGARIPANLLFGEGVAQTHEGRLLWSKLALKTSNPPHWLTTRLADPEASAAPQAYLELFNPVAPPGAVAELAYFTDDPAVWFLDVGDGQPRNVVDWLPDQRYALTYTARFTDTDEEFLKRVCQDVRGGPPTRVEQEYFLADQGPKKREKLLDTFLKDPAVARKLGDEWKQKMLGADKQRAVYRLKLAKQQTLYLHRLAYTNRLWALKDAKRPGRLDALLDQLLDGKRTDDQVLDALSAAVLGRLPTESERKLILADVGKQQDKPAAWRGVLTTLAGTEEAKKHAEELKK
jgi:RNA polymerase sigma factor (sigma-70 family)